MFYQQHLEWYRPTVFSLFLIPLKRPHADIKLAEKY